MVAVVAFAMATVGGAEAAEVGEAGEGVGAAEVGAVEQGVSTLGWRVRGP